MSAPPGDASSSEAAPILLIDAFSIFFRALHALPPMCTRRGLPTAALYGLSALLLKLYREQRPAGGAFALDLARPTFRHDAYSGYKEGRAAPPSDAPAQLVLLPTLIEATGLPAFSFPSYEADDVLATLAAEIAAAGGRPLIVSGDRDCLQLAHGPTRVLYVARGVQAACYDAEAVRERFGVPPELLPDYAALVGDPSDNLPGVPGIGPRTAARLLNEHGDLFKVLGNLEKLAPKDRERLRGHEEKLPFWRDLALLRTDVPLAPGPLHRPLDAATLAPLFEELEFTSLLPRLAALSPDPANGPSAPARPKPRAA